MARGGAGGARRPAWRRSIASVELAENMPASQRAVHVEVRGRRRRAALAPLGGRAHRPERARLVVAGAWQSSPAPPSSPTTCRRRTPVAPALRLSRNVRSFFQGNRFLLEPLVRHVVALVTAGPGRRSLRRRRPVRPGRGRGRARARDARRGRSDERRRSRRRTRRPFGARVRVLRRSVEAALAGRLGPIATCLVDPPRTGLSDDARAGVVRLGARRVDLRLVRRRHAGARQPRARRCRLRAHRLDRRRPVPVHRAHRDRGGLRSRAGQVGRVGLVGQVGNGWLPMRKRLCLTCPTRLPAHLSLREFGRRRRSPRRAARTRRSRGSSPGATARRRRSARRGLRRLR